VAGFREWLDAARASGLPELATFADSLRRDRPEVEAALTTEWSAGQTEGQINRLKTIKRQMYGRAGFDLLRRRVLRTYPRHTAKPLFGRPPPLLPIDRTPAWHHNI